MTNDTPNSKIAVSLGEIIRAKREGKINGPEASTLAGALRKIVNSDILDGDCATIGNKFLEFIADKNDTTHFPYAVKVGHPKDAPFIVCRYDLSDRNSVNEAYGLVRHAQDIGYITLEERRTHLTRFAQAGIQISNEEREFLNRKS